MRHTPSVRVQPIDWTDDEPPRTTAWQDGLWEVTCGECGDDRGPFERQSEVIRALRGPYLDVEEAKRVASLHSQHT